MKNIFRIIPKGYHSVTPQLVSNNASEALEFYKKAFGATVNYREDRSDGKIMHAEITIGDSKIMLADECRTHEGKEGQFVRSPEKLKGATSSLYLYVNDADTVFKKALENGGKEIMPLEDTFWGDRAGMLQDPYGQFWMIATRKEELSSKEIQSRKDEFCRAHAGVC